MKALLIGVALLAFGDPVHSQVTNCYSNTYGMTSCYGGGYVAPRVSPFAAFLNGFIEGRMARLRMEQMQLQNELLRRRLGQQ